MITIFFLSYSLSNVIYNIFCLIICRIKLPELNFFSLSVIGPQRFIFSSCIISDHCIGCIQNITCGSIVLLQLDHLGIFKILLKIKDIFYIGAPEFVNGLIIITDYAEIPVLRCQKSYQFKLHCIGILILIHHNIAKTFLIIFQHIRLRLEQLHGLDKKIVKIKCIVRF